MCPGVERSDLPDLRKFLDGLPAKPCPSKLPEEYCKMCKRLNGEVYNYCQKQELPPRPAAEALAKEPEYEEEPYREPGIPRKRAPILEKPRYEEGETPIEFAPSQKSIEEAKSSLPRFIPVKGGPRTFRAIEEPEEEFTTFDMEAPSIFRSPASIGVDEEDMMFSLVADENAIEVEPLEIGAEATLASETIYEGVDGVVEAVDIIEGTTEEIEVEPPIFEFIEEGEEEETIPEDKEIPEGYSLGDSMDEAERTIRALEAEIFEMTKVLEQGRTDEEAPKKEGSFKPTLAFVRTDEMPPSAEEGALGIPEAELPREMAPAMPKKRVKKVIRIKRVKKKKPKVEEIPEPEPIEEAYLHEAEEPAEPIEEPTAPEEIAFTTRAEMERPILEEEPGPIEEEFPPEAEEPGPMEERTAPEEIAFAPSFKMERPLEEEKPELAEGVKFEIKVTPEMEEEVGSEKAVKRVKLKKKKKKKLKMKKLKVKKPEASGEEDEGKEPPASEDESREEETTE